MTKRQLEKRQHGKKTKGQKNKKQKTKTKKRVQYSDVRAVSHSCDVFIQLWSNNNNGANRIMMQPKNMTRNKSYISLDLFMFKITIDNERKGKIWYQKVKGNQCHWNDQHLETQMRFTP